MDLTVDKGSLRAQKVPDVAGDVLPCNNLLCSKIINSVA